MINIQINAEGIAAIQRGLDPVRAMGNVAAAMDYQNTLTVGHIVQAYLSYPRQNPPTPQGLRVQTGLLRKSLRASRAVANGHTVTSSIGSNVKYAGVHEYGYTGPQSVRAFSRTRTNLFGKTVEPFTENVRAHTRQVDIKPRRPIFRGITDRLAAYSEAISQALVQSIEGGIA